MYFFFYIEEDLRDTIGPIIMQYAFVSLSMTEQREKIFQNICHMNDFTAAAPRFQMYDKICTMCAYIDVKKLFGNV